MRILIVDDNQQIMATLAEYLELDGFGVDCAYNGQMAIELVKQHDFWIEFFQVNPQSGISDQVFQCKSKKLDFC